MKQTFKRFVSLFKKGFSLSDAPEVTKYGKKSDSSKQQDMKVNQNILRDYFLSDPVIRNAVQTNVDNVCAGYDFELLDDSKDAEDQKKQAEDLFYKDNHMEKWRNIQMCIEVYDDTFQEVQTYLKQGEIAYDSYILETPSVRIKNKTDGEIDYYQQNLQGKEVAKIKPKDMIHYRFNAFGDRDYGLSAITTVLFSSAIRKFIDKYNASIFKNHKPRGVWLFPGEMPKDMYDDNVDSIIDGKNDPNKDLFLRGVGIDYKNFLDQKEVDFMRGYIEARNEILIGLGVPPIMMSLPEGSNKANGGAQLESYDRRVIAKQNSYAYKVNTEMLPKLGFDLIKFVCKKANKRDEERELNIANKMKGLATLNEVRKQIGLPEFDSAEYPKADQIWRDNVNEFGAEEEPAAGTEKSSKKIEKSVKSNQKKNLKRLKSQKRQSKK